MSNNTQNNDWIGDLIKTYASKLPPIYATVVTIALIYFGIQQPQLPILGTDTTSNQQYNSRADYERLQLDMTQIEVESILGRGIEVERSHSSTTLIWQNPDNSLIKAIFIDRKLQKKEQHNLVN